MRRYDAMLVQWPVTFSMVVAESEWHDHIYTINQLFWHFSRFFEYKRDVFIWTNETIIVATGLRHSELYISIYMTWMKLIFIEAIPYGTILVLNIAIIRKIIQSRDFRETFRPSQRPKKALCMSVSDEQVWLEFQLSMLKLQLFCNFSHLRLMFHTLKMVS